MPVVKHDDVNIVWDKCVVCGESLFVKAGFQYGANCFHHICIAKLSKLSHDIQSAEILNLRGELDLRGKLPDDKSGTSE